MRIIAGRLKNRRLESPTWQGLRPTSEQLRETLFNVLGGRVEGARVLDAFAGTGALGLEALSRGAREVVFVEQDRRAQALIAANVDRCGAAAGCAIIRAAVTPGLTALRDRAGFVPFDIILLDPPYSTTAWQPVGAQTAGPRGSSRGRAEVTRGSGTRRENRSDGVEDHTALLELMGTCLAETGVVVLEHAKRRPSPDSAGRLTRVRELTAGDSALSFYTCQL